MVNRVGQKLGNYLLTELIGRGGFGEVYVGSHIHLGRQAAIKILNVQLTRDGLDSFRNEGRIIAKLDHPNIVRILDFGVEDAVPFLVMDYAPNATLRQRYPRGSILDLQSIQTYVRQIASALQYAHDKKIIHRDIKPENMLIGQNGKILLSDFGIATMNYSTISGITQDTIVGTPIYMAPEVFDGRSGRASDQYSLGIVVYEWLSGTPPFVGHINEIAQQQLRASPPSLHKKFSHIPLEVEHVVLKALAKDQDDRFSSVLDFAAALDNAIERAHQNATASALPSISFERPNRTGRYLSLLRHIGSQARELSEEAAIFAKDVGEHAGERADELIEKLKRRTARTSAPEIKSISPNPSTALFPSSVLSEESLKDFFISYNKVDHSWAEWIAWQLEEEGYTVILPAWDFHAGSNFRKEMQKAAAKAKRTITVLSPDYLNAHNTNNSFQSLWNLVFRREEVGEQGSLIPVYIRECGNKFRKLRESTIYIDLIGLEESAARTMLLAGIRGQRIKPATPPSFPGTTTRRSLDDEPHFPVSNRLLTTLRVSTSALSKAMGKPDSATPTSITNTLLLQHIKVAFDKKDWSDVIRKTNILIRKTSDVSPEVYHLQGLALLEEGEMHKAYEALHTALALVTEHDHRLILLDECVSVLISLDRWNEVLRLSQEALRLAPSDLIWIECQQQALTHLKNTEQELKSPVGEPAIKPPIKLSEASQLPTSGITVFFSYSHRDTTLRDELDKWLRPLQYEGLITSWHDGKIEPGREWSKEIEEQLKTASIILLLVSANFVASKYCYGIEVQQAVARHEAGEARVIPIILRHADWHKAPFGKLQALPRNGRPVMDWPNPERAFLDVVRGIRKAVEELTLG